MGCQQKKQNNNQGGVHLTERTCSPYNPIIKQIVDDCLGLPIYPVTSVDAVIDENGDTLRKLLQDLLDKIKEGSFNVQQLQQMIEESLSRLSDIYASKEALNNLKALLWAISSIMSKSDNPTEDDLYVAGTSTPKIVDAVRRLQDIVCALTGTCEGQSGEDIPSIIDLKELLDILQDILVAIANFDTTYTVVDGNDLGLETKDSNARIKIIQEILDIKSLIGDGDEEGTPPDGGSLVQKIQWLIDNVKQLLTESETHAHLDLSVLNQMPESVRTGNNEAKKNLYKTLKASELPPTAIVVATSGSHINKQYGYPIYVGNLKKASVANDRLDFYPFGHPTIEGQQNQIGNPIKYIRRNPQTNEVLQEFYVTDTNNRVLRAGNGQFDMDDIVQSLQIISGSDVEFQESVKPSQLAIFQNNNATYANFVVDVGGTEYSVGDIMKDREVSVNDTNAIITAITTANSQQSDNQLSNMNNTQLFVFETSNNVDTVAMYPCIKGKTYVDVLTGNMYVYEGGRMNRVVSSKFVGTNGIEVNEVKDYEDEDATVLTKKEPYTKYTIGLDRDNPLIESEDEFTQFELSNPDDFKFTLQKYNVKCDLEYDEDRTSGALYYLDSYVFQTIPKASYLNAATNPYTPNPTFTIQDVSDAPFFFSELGNAFRSIILESLINNKQQAEAEENTAEVNRLEQQIAQTRSKFNSNPPASSNRPLTIWPNSPDPDVQPVVITGPYTKASVINQILDFDGDNYFTSNDIDEIGRRIQNGDDTATEKTVNTGIMLKRYTDNSQVTIESSPEVIGRIFEVVGENEYKTLYYFDKYGEFRPLLPDYSISFSNSVGELQLRRDGKVMSSLDIMEPIMQNVSSIVLANQQENQSNVRTKLLAVRNESQEINLGNDADPFFLGSPTYFDIDEINPDILSLFDNKLNLTVGSSFVHNQFDEEESLINLKDIPVPLGQSFLNDTDLEIDKIIEDLFTPIYDAIEEGTVTNEEVEQMLAEATANPIEYVQLKLHSNYINLEGNAAITDCWIYTIKKTITLQMDDIDHQSDYSTQVFRNMRVDIIDKVPVTVNTIYYFPKYDLRLKFDLATLDGRTYYEPVILSIGSRFDITKKNSTSDFTVIMPNYTEYIDIPNNYVSLDLEKLVNIPGYKQIKVHGILNFESTDNYYIDFQNNSLNYPMSQQENNSNSTPNSSPSIPPRTVNDQNTLNNVYPVNIAVQQIQPDRDTQKLMNGSHPAEFQYTIFNGYFNLAPL